MERAVSADHRNHDGRRVFTGRGGAGGDGGKGGQGFGGGMYILNGTSQFD